MGYAFTLFVAVIAIGFAALGGRALLRWRGAWRWAASLPLLVVLWVVGNIVMEIRVDPTSHNLWPFEVLGVVVIAIAALGVLELRRVVVARLRR